MFIDNNIVRLRFEFRENICVPGVADQNSTFATVRGTNGLPDAELQMPQAIHRVGGAQVREIRTKGHFEINNLDARLASRRQDFCGGADGLLNAGYINSSAAAHAALRAEI